MKKEIADEMKAQVAKFFDFKSWDEVVEEGGVGDFSISPDAFEDVLASDGKKSPFEIAGFTVVPFTTFDSSLHGEVVATYNLKLLGHVEYEQAEVNVYTLVDELEPAYLLYMQAEDGPTLFWC